MRVFLFSVLFLLPVVSCSQGAGSEPKCADEAKAATQAWRPSPDVPPPAPDRSAEVVKGPTIEVADVPLTGAIELMQKRTNERIELDIRAMPTATCTRVNIKVGGGATIGDALDALDATLAGTGLALVRGKGEHQIVKAGDLTRHTGGDCSIQDEAYSQWVIAGVKKIDAATVEIERGHLELWAEHFFRFYPSTDDPPGKRGFILDGRSNFETPAAVGAKKGDVLVAIQGVPLSWSADISTITRKVLSADAVTIDVVRGGKPMKLTLKVVP